MSKTDLTPADKGVAEIVSGETWSSNVAALIAERVKMQIEITRLRAALEAIAWHRNEVGGKLARAALENSNG